MSACYHIWVIATCTVPAREIPLSGGRWTGAAFQIRPGNRTDGPCTYTTATGQTVTDTWNSAYSHGAHDLSVHGPNGFLCRFAGHVENGRPGTSDPGLRTACPRARIAPVPQPPDCGTGYGQSLGPARGRWCAGREGGASRPAPTHPAQEASRRSGELHTHRIPART
ncbi:phospholipase domain-containing protein [Streptomyces jumonjinensis]